MENKICRIVKSKHILEVYFYDRLPGGGGVRKDEKIINMYGEVIEFPEVDNGVPLGRYDFSSWNDELGDYDRELPLKGFVPDEWLEDDPRDLRRAKEYRRTANYRSRERIRRLSVMNFKEGDLFLTLTFGENVTDIDFANDELKKFFKRFRYKYGKELPYLGVIEFQKRGAIHYHFLVGKEMGREFYEAVTSWGESEDLSKIWGHGFAYAKPITGIDNIGAYLIKYLMKNLGDDRLSGRKHYLISKGLEKSEVIKNAAEVKVILDSLEGYYPTFTSDYENFFCGKVKYLEYNLKRSG